MKSSFHLFLGLCILALCVSCGRKTENYASKEHGKKFDSWELHYHADEYDVYWPSLRLSEPSEGTLTVIKSRYNNWGRHFIGCDTTNTAVFFKPIIYSVKSRNDAKYYNSIRIQVNDANNEFWPRLEHNFTFNEGKKDSVSFSAKAEDGSYFKPSREISEKIIELLSKKASVNVKITFKGSSVEGVYDFNIEGSPELKKALKINTERKIQAQKEFEKEDAKIVKQLEDILS